nr:bifunctional diaminohydroxyphosphoribosylaminopyrimidine deaminase/5-amino-6-(5-phosphoribosylamino)uracil reductase RibD [Vallitalea okinawensis]
MNTEWMKRAITIAQKGEGFVNPNPLVGAIILKDKKIIGEGYHAYYGGPHAEVNAINQATENTKGATMFVTLEPCNHFGKTPPCTEAIIASGISKVVVGMLDPNELVTGKGIQRLREAGIQVEVGCLEQAIAEQNRFFLKHIQDKKPYVIMKYAASLDGKIATATGESKWITGEEARKAGHQLRQQVAGILVGVNTVIKDDPMLNVRIEKERLSHPIRIIVDSTGKTPLDSQIVQTAKEMTTIIATTDKMDKDKQKAYEAMGIEVIRLPEVDQHVDMKVLMHEVGQRGINSILIEGGGTIHESALKADIVDEVVVLLAPKLIGGKNALTAVEGKGFARLAEVPALRDMEVKVLGQDIMIKGKVRR